MIEKINTIPEHIRAGNGIGIVDDTILDSGINWKLRTGRVGKLSGEQGRRHKQADTE